MHMQARYTQAHIVYILISKHLESPAVHFVVDIDSEPKLLLQAFMQFSKRCY